MSATIYHNSRCSKSRQTLELLREHSSDIEIVEYLSTPPDAATLADILDKLGKEPRQLMRRNEVPYRELGLDDPGLDRAAATEGRSVQASQRRRCASKAHRRPGSFSPWPRCPS